MKKKFIINKSQKMNQKIKKFIKKFKKKIKNYKKCKIIQLTI